MWIWSLGWKDPLEEGMTTHLNILAWRIPIDRETWRATIHKVTKSRTRLKQLTLHACIFHRSWHKQGASLKSAEVIEHTRNRDFSCRRIRKILEAFCVLTVNLSQYKTVSFCSSVLSSSSREICLCVCPSHPYVWKILCFYYNHKQQANISNGAL